jgi:DnaK suppressor protein
MKKTETKTKDTKTVAKKIVQSTAPSLSIIKNRYSDEELEEFKELIAKKLDEAKQDLVLLRSSLSHSDDNSTNDTANTFKMMEDGSETTSREETAQLAVRQEKFIQHLENALSRIENKTYGICRVTGKLIQKERLKLVPHATLSIEAKQKLDRM